MCYVSLSDNYFSFDKFISGYSKFLIIVRVDCIVLPQYNISLGLTAYSNSIGDVENLAVVKVFICDNCLCMLVISVLHSLWYI